ncbi:MAG: hypothetical protein GY703_16430 [Gammaproteobacteria bacterium]|nr:hypothetical protein [Gammaproteobacteria bacterium]
MNTFFSSFIVSVLGAQVLRPVARRIGLVDKPGGRKKHSAQTPLIGGITIFVAVAVQLGWCSMTSSTELDHSAMIVALSLILVVGVLDDLVHLSVRLRFTMHGLIGLIMVYWGGVLLVDLGYLVSSDLLVLGLFGLPLTLFATLGTINSLNMVDGIDGLAGVLSLVVFSFLALLCYLADSHYFILAIAVLGALGGFLVFNFPRKTERQATIFMGDAGSNLLGFTLAWMFIALSQGDNPVIAPVTALWLYAIPLIDTVSVMLRRVWLKRSPFKADRGHMHHLLIDAGFRVRQIVFLMAAIQFVLAAIGVLMLWSDVPQSIGFFAFLSMFAIYFFLVSRIWRLVPWLRRIHRYLGLTVAGARSVYVGNLDPDDAGPIIQSLLGEEARDRSFILFCYQCPLTESKRAAAEIECWSIADMHRLIKILARTVNEEDRLEIRQFIPRSKDNDRRIEEWKQDSCLRRKCRRHSETIARGDSAFTCFRYPETLSTNR